MTYLDVKMKTLLKRQAKVNKAAYISSMRRQEAHDAIEDAIATAILKGAYLSQDIWTIPDGWADSNQRQHFAISMSTPTKPRLKAWGNIINYMKEHCYRVELAPHVSIICREDDMEIQSDDNEALAIFIKKHGIQVVCPDVDDLIDTLDDKAAFVKHIREELKPT